MDDSTLFAIRMPILASLLAAAVAVMGLSFQPLLAATAPIISVALLCVSAISAMVIIVALIVLLFRWPKYEADISVFDALTMAYRGSRWAKKNAKNWRDLPPVFYEKDKPESVIVEDRLHNAFLPEIHRRLRARRIHAWGVQTDPNSFHRTPEKPIPADDWDTIELSHSAPNSVPPNSVAAVFNKGTHKDKIAWACVRLSKKQMQREFPRAWFPRRLPDAEVLKL